MGHRGLVVLVAVGGLVGGLSLPAAAQEVAPTDENGRPADAIQQQPPASVPEQPPAPAPETPPVADNVPTDDAGDVDPDAGEGELLPEQPPFEPYTMLFPIVGEYGYVDTFGAPRSGNRRHKGTDVFAPKGTPVVAVADGVVTTVGVGALAGNYIVVTHDDGWRSYYIHLNNDTPGTDDGLGYVDADGIFVGARVVAGQLLNWVGDSGNAEETPPHVHFELHRPDGAVLNPFPHLLASEGKAVPLIYDGRTQPADPAAAAVAAPPPDPFAGAQFQHTSAVGHLALEGGFNADVWVHDGYAYVGSWGRPGICPGNGVRVVDVSDPTQPVMAGRLAGGEFPDTYVENAWVGAVDTASFTGDLAVAGVRLCDNGEQGRAADTFRGLALYDVTDPLTPVPLGTLDSGPRTQGVHEVEVVELPDGTLLAVATVLQSRLHHPDGVGDLRIVDITDPAAPVQLADWDFRRDAPLAVRDVLDERHPEELHAHSVYAGDDPTRLYVGHWDAGTVVLDISRPAVPAFVEAAGYTYDEEGNAHSSVVTPEGFLIQNHEDLDPEADELGMEEWGFQRIVDLTREEPTVSVFATENAVAGEDGEIGLDGYYSAHNAVYADGAEFATWYSDGVRVVDLRNPAGPTEVAWFVPPPAPDVHGWWVAPDGTRAFPMVWGVDVQDGLIYVSDVNSGLWVVRFDDPRTFGVDPVEEMATRH